MHYKLLIVATSVTLVLSVLVFVFMFNQNQLKNLNSDNVDQTAEIKSDNSYSFLSVSKLPTEIVEITHSPTITSIVSTPTIKPTVTISNPTPTQKVVTNTPKPTTIPTSTPTPTPLGPLPDLRIINSVPYVDPNTCKIETPITVRNFGPGEVSYMDTFIFGVKVTHQATNTKIFERTYSYSSYFYADYEMAFGWGGADWTATGTGNYVVYYWVDLPSQVIEVNENNNSSTTILNIDGSCSN